ncbi:MAG: polyprenol phosphomannose-dependent alpha 1,6 mannosyltransferase MptB [Acidimicrobiales bacterium]
MTAIDPGAQPRVLRPVSLEVCGIVGLAGSLAILLGIFQAGSPFSVRVADAWFFATTDGARTTGSGFFGVMLVDVGIVLMLGAWFELVRTVRRQPSVPMPRLVAVLVAWVAPVLVMPPLFSRDVYFYAAQGDMLRRGLNPYVHTASALGGGPFLDLVDPFWRHVLTAYGPVWERLSGAIVGLAPHDIPMAAAGFRLVALVGLGLIAWGVSSLARSVGRPNSVAFALGPLNPLVLLVLVGGAHIEALMLGLLVAGCALARRHHVLAGLVLCALAAQVELTALIGAVFIGWWWWHGNWRERVPRVVGALTIVLVLMGVISAVSNLGWHWLSGLADPGKIVSWLDPATALGLAIAHAAGALGAAGHSAGLVEISRGVGLGLAGVLAIVLLFRSERLGELEALGWSLLLFALLGPVVEPWYETWGLVVLAVVAERWTLRLVFGLSSLACFADMPPARSLAAPDPVLTVICWTVLVGAVGSYVVARLVPSFPGLGMPARSPESTRPRSTA